MKLFGSMEVKNNKLSIGGIDVSLLREEYGTPLYIIDERMIEDVGRLFVESFQHPSMETQVIYASKAFMNVAMAQKANELGLSLDVVSGGELYTAMKANFPANKIYFHGNNKLVQELELAVSYGVGTIVLDNRYEGDKLARILKNAGKKTRVLLRVNPGIEAHTHEYIKTTKNDSKFGESIYSQEIFDIVRKINSLPELVFDGFHCHIGSQIFEEDSFLNAAMTMLDFVKEIRDHTGLQTHTLNLGGGFGVYYTESDRPFPLNAFLKKLLEEINEKRITEKLGDMKILIEPGRSLICNAGSTLYEIGGTKETYGGRNYIFIDGGMTDNPRPALYQALYEAAIANKMNEPCTKCYTIAGKCCESGDIIIRDIMLPEAEEGDLLIVSSTGAYTFSMSSNYNRVERPAVVFVKDGKSRLVVRRQSYDDLIANDVL